MSSAILLSNLGSPDSYKTSDVRRYLNQFLMDERVLDMPFWKRRFVVSAFILPRRPRESGHAYQSIWWEEGSPLVVISKRLRDQVAALVDVPVSLGMRYGNPSIEAAMRELIDQAKTPLRRILFVPLYPHYAMSSFETAVAEAMRVCDKLDPSIELNIHPPFYDHPEFIGALVESSREYLNTEYDHLLFSYHGLPERHLRKTDPSGTHCLSSADCCGTPSSAFKTCYRAQVFRTTEAFVERAGIPADKYSISFQSRLGRDPWIKPSTDGELVRLARDGVRNLLVICPAFVSDCLETFEEIGIRAVAQFKAEGGETLRLIPCLNNNEQWAQALAGWCRERSTFDS